MTNIQFIAKVVTTTVINIQNVQLLKEDCTIPL
jgi:hypothetical protein